MSNENPKYQPVSALRRFQESGGRRSVRTDSGKTRRIPALPYEYWCKPSGNVVRLAVMTTRNTKEAVDPQRYADMARRRALREGWFPWEWAEVKAYAPHMADGCRGTEDWEKKRSQIQAQRRAEHNEMSARNSAWVNAASEQRKLETTEAFSVALKEFSEAMRTPAKPKGNG